MQKHGVLTVHSLWGCSAVDWHRLSAFLTNALLPIKRHAAPSWKWLPARNTHTVTSSLTKVIKSLSHDDEL